MTQSALNFDGHGQIDLPLVPRPWKETWVPYGRAFAILMSLKKLVSQEPSNRPQGVVLYGDTNNGKTMLARTFRDRINEEHAADTGADDKVPVVYVQTPPEGDINTLLWLLLRELNVPTPVSATATRRYAQLLHVLPQSGTKMLIFDEVHNVLAATRNGQEKFLQVLKFLSNELRIPIMCIGTVEVLRAIQTNQQNGNRFEPISLGRWRYGKPFITFANGLAKSMGIDHKEFFQDSDFTSSLHLMSEGLTGELRRILAHATSAAIEDDKDKFEPYMFEQIDWVPPSERRKQAEA